MSDGGKAAIQSANHDDDRLRNTVVFWLEEVLRSQRRIGPLQSSEWAISFIRKKI